MQQKLAAVSAEFPWMLITHEYPDTDAWACLWAADKFVVPANAERVISFLRAGERLADDQVENFNVLYMDTGGGELDQHGKSLERASSFQLLVKKYGLATDPGIIPILELTRATDNVERISPTDVHYLFKGYPRIFKTEDLKSVDWEGIMERVFEALNILYDQACLRARSAEEFKEFGKSTILPNGLKVSTVWYKPNLREAAFDEGADVVIWTEARGKKTFDVGIQVGRRSSVKLYSTMRALCMAEANKRGVHLKSWHIPPEGKLPGIPGWFLHDSHKLILCGSRSHRLEKGEHATLSTFKILSIVEAELAKMVIAQ